MTQIINTMAKNATLFFKKAGEKTPRSITLVPDGRPKSISDEDWALIQATPSAMRYLAKYADHGLTVIADEPKAAKPKAKRGKAAASAEVVPVVDEIGPPEDTE